MLYERIQIEAMFKLSTTIVILFVLFCALHGPLLAGENLIEMPGSPNYISAPAKNSLSEPKVVYGNDDRLDVYQETDPERRAWAASTCMLIYTSDLVYKDASTYTLRTAAYTVGGRPACPGEPFGNQPLVASWCCSGFMADNDIIVSAGHCISPTNYTNVAVVFGFEMQNATTPVLEFDVSQIYTPVEVISRQNTSSYDYSVIRVDRPITVAEPLPIREEGEIAVGEPVGVIGFPSGLPKKIAFGNATRVTSNTAPSFFKANLDTYGGNSGSPVFNAATGLVEGVLVRGNTDYIFEGTCFRSNTLPDDTLDSEQVTKSTVFSKWIHPGPVIPQNDLFINATVVSGNAVTVIGTNSNASKEPEEPNHAGNAGGASVWWRWTAPEDGAAICTTAGSEISTLLAVYTGEDVSSLEEVASSVPEQGDKHSQASFNAVSGTTYHIAVDGNNGAQGNIALQLTLIIPPAPLSVTPEQRITTPEAGTVTFAIETEGAWTALSNQTWATVQPASGVGNCELSISHSQNTNAERNALITITGENTDPPTVSVTIIQQAAPAPPDPPCCGCGASSEKKLPQSIPRILNDWLLLGFSR